MSTYDFNDPATKAQWVNVFLQGCYMNRLVLEQAVTTVTPAELGQSMGASVSQILFYEAMVSYWREYKAAPPPQALAIAIPKLVNQLVAYNDETKGAIVADISNLYGAIVVNPMNDEVTKMALSVMRHIYDKSRIQPQLSQILRDSEGSRVDDVYRKVTELKQHVRTDKVPRNVFALGAEGRMGEVYSSGLAWLDELIGGGFRYGEAYGVLGPTGGGKTTLTAQVACSLAVQGKKSLVLVTEQSFEESTLRAKYWATVAQKPWEEFLKYKDVSEIPDELVPPPIKAQIATIGHHIMAFDMRDLNSMDDVRALVAQFKPDIVMLDWAGTMADRLMSDKKNPWNNDRALCLRSIANDMNAIAKENKTVSLVYHQLAPAAGTNPFRDYDHTMAMECRSFFFNLSYALILCPKDKNSILRVRCTKYRLSGDRSQIVRLNGPLASFEPLAGYRKNAGVWAPPSATSQSIPAAKDRAEI